jgi:2-amino-4-hydroxy-6-hydroxymethyldihydropteridine diphosphokinase
LNENPGTSPELALISLGSNIEPERYLPLAAQQLRSLGRVLGASTVYQNPAIGPTPQADFLNAVVLIETSLTAADLRERLRGIEASLGRVRSRDKFAPRTIDLDLLLLGDRVMEDPEHLVPDPELLSRAHLAIPAAELMPEFVHPVTGERLRAIADRLSMHGHLAPRSDVRLRTEPR